MKTFAKANPDLVVAELVFYAEKDKEHRKEDEKHAHRISMVVDELFNQLDWEGRGRGETVYRDYELGPSSGGAMDINWYNDDFDGTLCVQRLLPRDGLV